MSNRKIDAIHIKFDYHHKAFEDCLRKYAPQVKELLEQFIKKPIVNENGK